MEKQTLSNVMNPAAETKGLANTKQPLRLSTRCLELLSINSITDEDEFIKKFGASCQLYLCQDIKDCFFGEYPTLKELSDYYDSNIAIKIIMAHLVNLSEHEGCKGKITAEQLLETATIIVMHFPDLKISEVIVFFNLFKAGKFGRFYGTVDPGIIMEQLNVFIEDILVPAHDKHDNDNQVKEYLHSLHEGVSWDEYCATLGMVGKTDPRLTVLERLKISGGNNPQGATDPKGKCDTVLQSAMAITDNKFGFDREGIKMAVSSFHKRYGVLPEEYIEKVNRT